MAIPFARLSFPDMYEQFLVGPLFRPWAEGVLEAEVFLAAGDVVGPLRRADDRHGYVLATGPTTVHALANADDAVEFLVVEAD